MTKDIFRTIRPLLRIVPLFILLLTISACSTSQTIVNGIGEREANEIVVLLASKGIHAYKTKAAATGPGGGGGPVLWDISVDPSQAVEAMAILNANGLPKQRGENLLNLFTNTGLVPSEMSEKIRYRAGLAAQIANTIKKIDGIIDADVQLSFPEENPLNPNQKTSPVTAAVFVKHNGVLDNPNSHLASKIKLLVAASVPGLSYDNVTVIPVRAQFPYSTGQQQQQVSPQEELVTIWNIPIAKAGVTTFQVFFFSLISIAGLTLLLFFWLVWKILPVAHHCGGIKTLFSFHPLKLPPEQPQEEASKAGPEASEKPEEKKPKEQENVE